MIFYFEVDEIQVGIILLIMIYVQNRNHDLYQLDVCFFVGMCIGKLVMVRF